MRTRCNNPKCVSYVRYGAVGIKVCPEWNSPEGFIKFLEDVGPKPSPNHSLDRIDFRGDYTKDNVRWIPKVEQAKNTSKNRNITYNGKTLCAAEWDRELDLTPGTVLRRIDVNGWDIHKALSTPRLVRVPRTPGFNRGSGCANQSAMDVSARWWLAD